MTPVEPPHADVSGFFRAFFGSSRDAVLMAAPDGAICAANAAACALFGRTEHELCRAGQEGLVDPSARTQARALGWWSDADVARAELDFVRGDGTSFRGEFSSARCWDEAGRERRFVTVRDLSARAGAEVELAESRALLDAIVNSTQDLIWSVDARDFGVVWHNRAFADYLLHQRGMEARRGQRPQDLFADPAYVDLWRGFYRQTLERGRLSTEYTTYARSAVLQLTMSRLERGGQVFGISVFGRDITEQKQAAQQIADSVHRLEDAMQQTLQAVAGMVELRDPYTSGHERRVGLIAADIARELGWPESRCRHLSLVGFVHDIGKIAIPAEILHKPSRLTPLEYRLVQAHAAKGCEILRSVSFPMPIAEIVHQHHERMDGSGYPRGLAGEAILPEARVLAVADVLESMTSHRPYRAAMSPSVAFEELQRQSGVLYDAPVVAAVARLLGRERYRLPSGK